MANKTIKDFPESTSPSGDWFILVDDGTGCYKKVKLRNIPGTTFPSTTSSTTTNLTTTTSSTSTSTSSTTSSTTTTSP